MFTSNASSPTYIKEKVHKIKHLNDWYRLLSQELHSSGFLILIQIFIWFFNNPKEIKNSGFNKSTLRRPTIFSPVLDWECRKTAYVLVCVIENMEYKGMHSQQTIRIFKINCICLEHKYYLPRSNYIFLPNSFGLVLVFWELQWPKLWWSLHSSNLPSAWECHQDHQSHTFVSSERGRRTVFNKLKGHFCLSNIHLLSAVLRLL